MKKVIDITGMTRAEVKTLCKAENYTKSTFYKAFKRKTLKVTVN